MADESLRETIFFFIAAWGTHRCLHCQKFFIKQLSRNNDDEYLKDGQNKARVEREQS